MENIRIKFSKTGNVKYISHLDLNRFFQRAFKRSGVPIWVTEGFNPHIYLNFLLPLSLGTESVAEYVDCKFTTYIPYDEAREKLNSVMPEGFKIESVAQPLEKAEKIAYCRYILEFPENSREQIKAFFENEKIEVVKKTKRKEYTVDLKREIKEYTLSKDGEVKLELILPAGEGRTINPELLIKAFSAFLGEEVFARIKRTAVLNENLEDFK